MRTAPATPANGPSIALPLAFVLTGLAALCAGVVWLVLQPGLLSTYHYNQDVIAVTHLFVLGWICTIIMGAMYQLVPVALETHLYSNKLGCAQFVFHLVGVAGMVWAFRARKMAALAHYASVFAFGVILFVYNMARTLRRTPRWNITASAVAASLFWISMAVTAGLSIAAAKCDYDPALALAPPAWIAAILRGLQSFGVYVAHFGAIRTMHAHAHLGGAGFFIMLIVGVSYKLVPMFTLSEVQSRARAVGSIILLNIGLAGSFLAILRHSPLESPFACVIVAALALYGWELAAILRARKRRALDWGVKYFLTAVALLLPVSALSLVLCWSGLPQNTFTGQLENLYGFLALIGVVTFAILGMLYKIVPFLVWFGQYSRLIGRVPVPSLPDLYSARLQSLGYRAFLIGLAATSEGILLSNETGVRIGCGFLALAVSTMALNVAGMLSHFFKPALPPAFKTSTPLKTA
jgi:hypothetical protein